MSSNSSVDEGSDELSSNDEYSSEEVEEKDSSDADIDLFEAISRNDDTAVLEALHTSANVNCDTKRQYYTPLLEASRAGYDEIVCILLIAGADPWWQDFHGSSAMWVAVEEGHLLVVEMLLDHDEGLLEIVDGHGFTPLLVALLHGRFEIVHFLLDLGANALATTEYGLTTLLFACQVRADLDIVRQLLVVGLDVEARDERRKFCIASRCIPLQRRRRARIGGRAQRKHIRMGGRWANAL